MDDCTHFIPNYPLRLRCFNQYGRFGQEPPTVRHKLNLSPAVEDSRLLWLVLTMFTSVPTCWKNLADSVERKSRLHGWFLAFATHYCLKELKMKRTKNDNPYWRVLSPVAILRKLFVAAAGSEHLGEGELDGFDSTFARQTTLD
mmetsp:Transcript_22746/g.47240  ORF Transcript_22746/g.47240 Transcript_22746/m.47240 type:complete len:144 (-) Transcript_22746:1050-1481(-)